tara:strand:- start:237 stop:461 length:225 start_codon:yes stop_codon:yes gene_type:complete
MPFDEKQTPYDGNRKKYVITYAVEEQYQITVQGNNADQAGLAFLAKLKSQDEKVFSKGSMVKEEYKLISCKPTN